MKLDNRGWGLIDMLWICAAIIIAGFISYAIYKQTFGDADIMNYSANQSDKTTSTISYSKVESEMVTAANKYVKDEKIDMEDISTFYVKLSILVRDKYIDEVVDGNSKCNGYVKVTPNHKTAYLKCSNYTTLGYESEYD